MKPHRFCGGTVRFRAGFSPEKATHSCVEAGSSRESPGHLEIFPVSLQRYGEHGVYGGGVEGGERGLITFKTSTGTNRGLCSGYVIKWGGGWSRRRAVGQFKIGLSHGVVPEKAA